MEPAVVLLLLRLLSAVLLLLFFGAIGWLIYRDISLQTGADGRRSVVLGELRVVVTEDNEQPRQQEVFPLYAETWIGRASSNAVVLDDAFTSNEHAVIRQKGGRWWLEDLESRNGTLLNDVPLDSPAVVTSGDIVTVGRTSLEIDLEMSK